MNGDLVWLSTEVPKDHRVQSPACQVQRQAQPQSSTHDLVCFFQLALSIRCPPDNHLCPTSSCSGQNFSLSLIGKGLQALASHSTLWQQSSMWPAAHALVIKSSTDNCRNQADKAHEWRQSPKITQPANTDCAGGPDCAGATRTNQANQAEEPQP